MKKGNPSRSSHFAAGRIATVYLLLSVIWIYTSDHILAGFIHDPIRLTSAQTWKGWFFVLTTSSLLFILVRRALGALHASEVRYRSIFENNHAVMLVIDPVDGRIVDANAAAVRWYGWTKEELCRRRIDEINTLSEEEIRSEMEKATERQIWHFIFRHRRADGSVRDVEVFSGPVTIKEQTLLYSIVHDITEKKLAEEEIYRLNAELEDRVRRRTVELETVNRELESFAYSVSHDLRAPLRAIDGFTHILHEEYASRLDTEGNRLCSIISSNARRMGQLIDDLLAFSRLGRTEFKQVPVDMTALAATVFDELTIARNREQIIFNLAPLPPVVGDPGLLRQVWVNLLDNAVKFSTRAEQPAIAVEALEQGGEIVYAVSDNGAGFDMRYTGKLFGVFQRLHGEKEFPGTGLGLALAQRIVQRHGGRIWGEGVPGAGATFFFTLRRNEV